MDDLVYRKDVIELIKNSYYNLADSMEDMWAMVSDAEKLPFVTPKAKEPEIIRCRECKWAKRHRLFDLEYLQCERSELPEYHVVQVDDFCSYAERREEGDNQ